MAKQRKYKKSKPSTISGIEVESHLEETFLNAWLSRYPKYPPQSQFIFHPTRKWRFDFCWQQEKLAVEIQGYGPGHCSRKGMANDANKNNAALALGYSTCFFTSFHLTPASIDGTINSVAYLLYLRRNSN